MKTISDITKNERKKYRDVLGDTYCLIDTTLNMVIIRLGDIQLFNKDNDFIEEAWWAQPTKYPELLSLANYKTVKHSALVDKHGYIQKEGFDKET